MKYVINTCYGGFGVSENALNDMGLTNEQRYSVKRTDERLIKLIEEKGSEYCSTDLSSLLVVEIPDEATDWALDEYDGSESITYVIDGKLNYIC